MCSVDRGTRMARIIRGDSVPTGVSEQEPMEDACSWDYDLQRLQPDVERHTSCPELR